MRDKELNTCGRMTPPDVPEMEEVKPGKWACPAHEDVVVVATRQPMCPECEEPTDV